MCLNQVTLIGYAGDVPEVLKDTSNGKFVRFSLATSKKYTDKQGHPQQTTQWHTIYASNGRGAALAAHLQKGALILVVGELRYNQWKDKKTIYCRTGSLETALYRLTVPSFFCFLVLKVL